MFLDDINEILLSDEYDEEDVNGENCGRNEEEFWIDILKSLDSLKLCFLSIVTLKTHDTKFINLAVALLLRLALFYKNCRRCLKFFANHMQFLYIFMT